MSSAQPGEREERLRDVAERQAEPYEQPHADAVIHKARPIEAAQPEAARTRSMTDEWARYIKQQVSKSERAMGGAVADVLVDIEKQQKAAIDDVRQELATLRNELAELRGEAKLRGSLDAVTERLDRIEQERSARQPLKAISG